MSPLFRDRLFIEISPRRLSVSILKKGWRPQMQSLGSVSFEKIDGERSWTAAINVLKQWLFANKYQSTDIQLLISDSFTRYVLLPWSNGVKKKDELAMMAKIHFDASFGTTERYANIVFDFSSHAQPGIACAIESDFLSALKAICNSNKNRLISVEPRFVKTFNLWRNRIGKEGLVVCAEDEYCVMSFIKDDNWKSIRTIKFAGDMQDSLPRLIERETILQGVDDKMRIYLDLSSGMDAAAFLKIPQIHLLGRASGVPHMQKSDVIASAV